VPSAVRSLLCVSGLVIMADERLIWVEVENEKEALVLIDAYHNVVRDRAADLLEELAKDGVTFLAKNVPNYKGYTLEHVDRSGIDKTGTEMSTTVGIKAGTSYHPVYANRGTGIFGPFVKQPYTALPGNASGKMWFFSTRYGRVIGVRSVKGQSAQHFLYTTFRELQVFALARLNLGI
jgi:hypothetical protein